MIWVLPVVKEKNGDCGIHEVKLESSMALGLKWINSHGEASYGHEIPSSVSQFQPEEPKNIYSCSTKSKFPASLKWFFAFVEDESDSWFMNPGGIRDNNVKKNLGRIKDLSDEEGEVISISLSSWLV